MEAKHHLRKHQPTNQCILENHPILPGVEKITKLYCLMAEILRKLVVMHPIKRDFRAQSMVALEFLTSQLNYNRKNH